MLPFAKVKLPTAEPVASVATPAPNVPVVLKFSSPKSDRSTGISDAAVRQSQVANCRTSSERSNACTQRTRCAQVLIAEVIAPLESVMLPFAKVKLPTAEPVASVATPAPNVPVVLKFSSPKLIAPLESVMLPFAKVKLPTAEPVASVATPAPNVPVVLKFSSPKSIAPLESVMLPFAKVKLPTAEPVASVATPAPNVPVVLKFSSPKLIAPLESVMLPFAKVKLPTAEPVASVSNACTQRTRCAQVLIAEADRSTGISDAAVRQSQVANCRTSSERDRTPSSVQVRIASNNQAISYMNRRRESCVELHV